MAPALLCLMLLLPVQGNESALSVDGSLADSIVDGSYGVSIRPPKDWRIIRQRVPERRGVTLVQMVHPLGAGQMEELVLRYTSTTQPVPIDEMLPRLSETLELEYAGVEIHFQQQQEIAGRRGGVLAASFMRDGRRKFRMQAIIEARPQIYFVLLYEGPADLRTGSEPLFNLVLGSLELLLDQVKEEDLAASLEHGKRFLAGLRGEDIQRSIVPEQFLQFEAEGKVIGFVAVWQTEQERDGRPGVGIRERAWTFEPDGRTRRLQSNLWVSLDLRHERWKTSVTTLSPASPDRPAALEVTLEEGLRTERVLLTNQQFGIDQPQTENPPIRLPDTYAPRALIRMLPRLLDASDKPRMLAFVTFDPARVGMIARLIELTGEAELPSGASKGKVYRIEDREGLAAHPTVMYVDEDGHTLRVEAGELLITPTSSKELERLFSSRIESAEQQMAELESAHRASEQRFRRRSGP